MANQIILIINGEEKTFSNGVTINDILHELKIFDKVMAVAVNLEVVKKEDWEKFKPQNNDKVEFLQFVGGG
jgi:sulfur carrier protein